MFPTEPLLVKDSLDRAIRDSHAAPIDLYIAHPLSNSVQLNDDESRPKKTKSTSDYFKREEHTASNYFTTEAIKPITQNLLRLLNASTNRRE